jgi:hypothetical protein
MFGASHSASFFPTLDGSLINCWVENSKLLHIDDQKQLNSIWKLLHANAQAKVLKSWFEK